MASFLQTVVFMVYQSSPQCVWAPSLGWHQLGWWSPQLGEEPGRQVTMIQTCDNKEKLSITSHSLVCLPFYPHNSNRQQSAKFTLKPHYTEGHDATANSYQEDLYHIYPLTSSWYIPHQGTPHWPVTLSVMSSPPWLHRQIHFFN